MRYLKSVLFSTILLCAPSVWAQAVGGAAAGTPGSRLYSQLFTSSGSFLVPVGVSTIFVTGCAGGGGGAGGYSADPGGGGGGGAPGLCVSRLPMQVTAGSTLTLTVGSAGAGGAAGSNGGKTNVDTIIAGLPIGTWTLIGPTTSAIAGTVTNGGAGGIVSQLGGNGATSTGAGNPGTAIVQRGAGGDYMTTTGGGGGGGATGPGAGGVGLSVSMYNSFANIAGGSASGTKGGGGGGGGSPYGIGGAGGTNAAGTVCTAGGYGAGGGGGAPTFAGGNGCAGFLKIEWWN